MDHRVAHYCRSRGRTETVSRRLGDLGGPRDEGRTQDLILGNDIAIRGSWPRTSCPGLLLSPSLVSGGDMPEILFGIRLL